MAITWDWVLTILILVGLFLAIWARITQQTIKELLEDIRDFIIETKDKSVDKGVDLVYYE